MREFKDGITGRSGERATEPVAAVEDTDSSS
jgi:hypothetical protein